MKVGGLVTFNCSPVQIASCANLLSAIISKIIMTSVNPALAFGEKEIIPLSNLGKVVIY